MQALRGPRNVADIGLYTCSGPYLFPHRLPDRAPDPNGRSFSAAASQPLRRRDARRTSDASASDSIHT